MPGGATHAPRRWREAATTLCLAGLATAAHPLELHGVSLPERLQIAAQGPELVLNGAGVRVHATRPLYVASLYLPQKQTDLKRIAAAEGPKRIGLALLKPAGYDVVSEILLEGLSDSHTASEMESLQVPLDELMVVLRQALGTRKARTLTFDLVPAGTRVSVDGTGRARPIAGAELYAALLRIWLSEDATDKRLRRALLGG